MNPLGLIFGENILKNRNIQYKAEGKHRDTFYRFYLFIAILLVGFALLFIRLFTLTMLEGASFRKLSSENRVREANLPATRGIIYDRNKNPLVRNIPVYTGIDGKILFNKPFDEAQDKSREKELFIESATREYIYGEIFGNLIGYTGEASPSDLKKLASLGEKTDIRPLKLKDKVGKMGVEEAFDETLRGRDGQELYEVDATGKYVRTLGIAESRTGVSLNLNIDLNLSKAADQLMKGRRGAVVVSIPNSGEILVLYSSPNFDPNKILKAEDLDAIFESPDKPLFNRSISGVYPPGSTFKIITSLAGLESGAVKAQTTIEDTGIIKIGDKYSYSNWYFTQYGKIEGQVNLVRALQRSNDIYFYKIGEKTGIATLADWGKKLGIGKRLGIEISSEEAGLMPDPVWRARSKGEDWFLGNTYHTAIGQGDVLVTPLQVNFWTNVIANGGKLCRPYLVANKNPQCEALPIKKENIEIVREGLIKACQEGGTGWPLFNFKINSDKLKIDKINFIESEASGGAKMTGITTACKTGTAEFGHPKNLTHAWFTVFAPAYSPQISVTVLVEEGGEGSSVAAPIARELLKVWFER